MDAPDFPQPGPPHAETRRLAELDRYGILDTPAEQGFDDIVALASRICGTPVALVSLVGGDRQWFKARIGFAFAQTPLSQSVCTHALQRPGLLVIPDLTADPRTRDNPLVVEAPHIRFYAGARLETPDGTVLGTLCVIDTAPRPQGLTPEQGGSLEALARQVLALMELRRALGAVQAMNASLEAQVIARTQHRSRTWHVSPDLLGVMNAEGHFESSNPAWQTLLGYSEAEVSSTVFFDFLHPDDLERSQAAWEAALLGQPALSFENRYRHKDGTYRWLSWVAVPEGGKVYCSARDVTGEKTQAAELTARTRERDRLWDTTNDLMGMAALDGFMKTINPAWTRMLGWSETELLSRPFAAFIDPADHADTADVVRRLAAGETVTDVVNRLRGKDERWRTVMWTAVPEPGSGVFYIVGRDITEQRQAEEMMRQSQKLEAVGQLTGGVAHDFNNLLTVIKSSSDLLKRPDLSEDRRRRYVEAISDTVDRASKLTGQLLAFARRQALRPTVFDATESVRAVGDMIGALTGARIAVMIRAPAEPCLINADASQFDTALVNMAVNARDAMAGEGELTITVAAVSAMPAIRSHPSRAGDYVSVALTDTGSGIPADRTARIFEPFYTTKAVGQGTGLGLSQVFGFAKQSDGEIMVESEVGRGSTFTLFLPRVRSIGGAGEKPTEAEPIVEGRGTRVLVVEDNRDVGAFSTQTLAELGYDPHWVTSAEEALARLAADAPAFDVVFSDVMMPGMNGVAFAQEVGRLYPGLPVVLTSGYSDVLMRDAAHGFELLQKPYSLEALSRILKGASGRRRPNTPGAGRGM